MSEVGKTNSSAATLDRNQNEGDLVKPVELIAVEGTSALGLVERRIYNVLIKHAFGPELAEPGKHFKVATAELRDAGETNELLVLSCAVQMTA